MLVLSVLAAASMAPPARSGGCATAAEIVQAARVSPLPTGAAALDLELVAPGLTVVEADSVGWAGCSVDLRSRLSGPYAITASGIPITPGEGGLLVRHEPILDPDPEPDHPTINGGEFLGSTSLAAGTMRAGLWRQPHGIFLVASYRPGQREAPRPLIRSSKRVLGVSYLGAPDAAGGMFTLWQQPSRGRYRFVRVRWSEEGLR